MAKRRKRPSIALEANYTTTSAVGVTSFMGARTAFSLKKVKAVDKMEELRHAIADDSRVIFWVTHPAGAEKYTLISVGKDTEPLVALRLDHAAAIAPLVASGQCLPLDQEAAFSAPLGGPGTSVKSLTVWMEAPTGDRYPFPIDFIGHVDTAGDAKMMFADVALAVLETGSKDHRAIWLLDPQTADAPGPDDDCQALRASGSFWSQLWASISGCP